MPVNRLRMKALLLILGLVFIQATWADDSAPSMAFLEFLAELDNDDGAWLDQQEKELNDTESTDREVQKND